MAHRYQIEFCKYVKNTYEDYLLCLKDHKQNKALKNSTTNKNESIFNKSK